MQKQRSFCGGTGFIAGGKQDEDGITGKHVAAVVPRRIHEGRQWRRDTVKVHCNLAGKRFLARRDADVDVGIRSGVGVGNMGRGKTSTVIGIGRTNKRWPSNTAFAVTV